MGEGSSPQFSLPLLPGPEVAPIPKPLASLSSGSHRQIRIIISREGIWILSPVPVRELASAAQASCFHSQPGAATAGVGPRETLCEQSDSAGISPASHMAQGSRVSHLRACFPDRHMPHIWGLQVARRPPPGRTGRPSARAGLDPGKMDVDGSGWGWGWGRGRGRAWLLMRGGPA